MKTIKLIVVCIALSSALGVAQEMTTEWYRQKDESWARTRADFPQSATPGPFKTRMLEIEAWAKTNDPQLYYNSSKPYLLARMVQREIDAEAPKRNPQPRPAPSKSVPQQVDSQLPGTGDSGRGGITGSTLETIWLGGAIIIIVTSGVAFGLHWIIRPRRGAISAGSLGRKWAAWIVAIGTISCLPSFFRKLDGSSLALWFLVVPVSGVIAFLIGWIIGLFKFRLGERQSIPPQLLDSSPPLPTGFDADAKNSPQGNPEVLTLSEDGPIQATADESQNDSHQPIMKNTEFEVVVPEGKELGDGYVEMCHNSQYSLNLKNHRRVRCDAEVKIDGIHVGTWRIDATNEILIERPVHDTGHFTFFEVGTAEAGLAGISKKSENGLVSVTFFPERVRLFEGLNASPLPDCRQGASGLTGEIQQRFHDAPEIVHDMARAFTIHLRLVSARPDIRPLAPRSTPVPPPVD